MLKEECTIQFEDIKFEKCDPCRHYYFRKRQAIKLKTGFLIVTLNYDFKTCFQGLGQGDYLNSITLLPSEEQSLEIIRRHKYTRSLHEQNSIETEIENSFTHTLRNTVNMTNDIKFSMKTEGGFEILDIGAKLSTELSTQLKMFYERFEEIIRKTQVSVSRKYDFSIDISTEQENTLRSIRKIKNPNNCHPVHYLISQLMKKYKSELILESIEFDYKPKLPKEFLKGENSIKLIKPLYLPFNFFTKKQEESNKENRIIESTSENILLEPVTIRSFRKSEFIRVVKPNLKDEISKVIEELEKKDEFIPGVKSSKEYCVRTSDIYVESKLGKCSVCCQDEC